MPHARAIRPRMSLRPAEPIVKVGVAAHPQLLLGGARHIFTRVGTAPGRELILVAAPAKHGTETPFKAKSPPPLSENMLRLIFCVLSGNIWNYPERIFPTRFSPATNPHFEFPI